MYGASGREHRLRTSCCATSHRRKTRRWYTIRTARLVGHVAHCKRVIGSLLRHLAHARCMPDRRGCVRCVCDLDGCCTHVRASRFCDAKGGETGAIRFSLVQLYRIVRVVKIHSNGYFEGFSIAIAMHAHAECTNKHITIQSSRSRQTICKNQTLSRPFPAARLPPRHSPQLPLRIIASQSLRRKPQYEHIAPGHQHTATPS